MRRYGDTWTRQNRDDLAQEATIASWRWAAAMATPERFTIAVATIAKRVRGRALRAERRQQRMLAGFFAARDTVVGGEPWFTVAGHRLPASQLQPWLQAALAALSSLDRQLMLAFHEGFCCDELAERFCQTPSCVKTRIHRARNRVRAEVEASVCKALALAP
ncbi:MAG: hypothetical protein JNK15_07855 [Planctomycetes bacterium]|nr:hypothetical protein [Planctomycetota bacterium]